MIPMDLYILRHAIAVERGTIGYETDSTRPLTGEGAKKMHQNALGMKALDLSFDIVLSSPLLRAKQTAEIVCKVFKIKQNSIISTKNLVPDASFQDLLIEINAHGKNIKSVLLVGHEPHLSELISFLLTSKQTLPLILKKGGLCHLITGSTPKAGSATIDWLLTPSQLRLIK